VGLGNEKRAHCQLDVVSQTVYLYVRGERGKHLGDGGRWD
jgi:hypothetical protein